MSGRSPGVRRPPAAFSLLLHCTQSAQGLRKPHKVNFSLPAIIYNRLLKWLLFVSELDLSSELSPASSFSCPLA